MEEIKNIDSILIKNGQIVTESRIVKNDIFCRKGIIEFIGDSSDIIETIPDQTEIIDAENMFVIPGGIDPHVHFDLPIGNGLKSSDSFETGSKAAIFGGTTTIFDFVTPKRGESLLKSLKYRREEAKESFCNYRLHMSITEWNENTENEMKNCVLKEGIKSFKVYMAYKKTIGLDNKDIQKVMRVASDLDAVVMVHCEDGDRIDELKENLEKLGKIEIKYHSISRPPETEGDAVKKIIELSNQIDCKTYIVHNSTKKGLDAVEPYKKNGNIFVETCPHYLLLDDSKYEDSEFENSSKFIMSPPLRSLDDQDALWIGLMNGMIDVVATDHCPFNKKDRLIYKEDGFFNVPNGVGSVEHRLSLLYTHGVLPDRIDMNQFVSILSTNPAKIFGLYPQKGVLAVGSDSDIVIWNPKGTFVISSNTQKQNCDTSIYEGHSLMGKPYIVIIGEKIFKN